MLGANGAGKTTLLRAINGALGQVSGSIRFDGEELVGMAPEKISRLGVCQVPEGRGTFVELTVSENLEIGAWRRKERTAINTDRDRMFEMFPILAERRGQSQTIDATELRVAVESECHHRGHSLPLQLTLPDKTWRNGYSAIARTVPDLSVQAADDALTIAVSLFQPIFDDRADGTWKPSEQQWV